VRRPLSFAIAVGAAKQRVASSPVGSRREEFRLLQGRELIQTYDAPIREAPPAYAPASVVAAVARTDHSQIHCGSKCLRAFWTTTAASPDKHIFVRSNLVFAIRTIAQLDKAALLRLRQTQTQP